MPQFCASLGQGDDWRSATENCLAQLTGCAEANVGFVYVTDVIAAQLQDVLELLQHDTGIEHWIGTVGMGVCGVAAEVYDHAAVSVLVGKLNDGEFKTFSTAAADLSDLAVDTQTWIDANHAYFGVIHGDPTKPQLTSVLENLSERLGGGFLVGGLTCSRHDNGQIAGQLQDTALSGMLFHPNVRVSTRLTQGCSPLGDTHVVTRADNNLVHTLDGKPALDVLREQLGGISNEQLAQLGGYLFVGLPIRGSDTGDYLVRHLIGVDPNSGIIALDANIESAQRLMFCRRDRDSAEKDLRRMLNELKQAEPGKPLGGLYFTCIGRGKNLFEAPGAELQIVHEVLGDFPLSGFYANGEISHDRLYAYTGVLTLFH